MRVLVTGAGGFVGRWLIADLEAAGHDAVPAPSHHELDLASPGAADAVAAVVAQIQPDAVVHLAAVSFAPDAERDPEGAIAVNGGGTAALFAGLDLAGSPAPALVVSSADVYGTPTHLPIREDAETEPSHAYGRSKLAQEEAAFAAQRRGRPILVVRPFNQVGPGQRASFVAPALARRVLAVKAGSAPGITIGNVDVRRDFSDVRDVARAHRLLLEALLAGAIDLERPIVNVGSGRSIEIRELLTILCRLADVPMEIRQDPSLVRPGEAREIRADNSLVRQLVGWSPEIPLERSLADLLASLEEHPATATSADSGPST